MSVHGPFKNVLREDATIIITILLKYVNRLSHAITSTEENKGRSNNDLAPSGSKKGYSGQLEVYSDGCWVW